MARILVTGVTGQIGSYVAEHLIAGGHEVVGLPGLEGVPVPAGVVACATALTAEAAPLLLEEAGEVDAVIHLAGRSSVAASWQDPVGAFEVNAGRTVALLYAVAERPGVRFVHASSAEIFGDAKSPTQNESTPIAPLSPYAVAKAAAHMAVRVARAGIGVPASNAIFYLGESPRRSPGFVFRKITRTVAAIARGEAEHLVLGNTAVVRDFCHAKDLARAAAMLALGGEAGDYVCASGEGHSILELAHVACGLAGIDPEKTLRFDPALVRPNDIASLVGDARKMRARGWTPTVGFRELVREVYEHDLRDRPAKD